MGRSGLVGLTTLLLLLLVAFVVLRQAGAEAGSLAPFGAALDTSAVQGEIDPRIQPFRTPSTRAATDQADRMLRDIEAMGQAAP